RRAMVGVRRRSRLARKPATVRRDSCWVVVMAWAWAHELVVCAASRRARLWGSARSGSVSAMPAPPGFQMVVNAAIRSPGGGSGRGVPRRWWPAGASAETVVSAAAAHAGCTVSPPAGEPASTPIRSPVGGSMVAAVAKGRGGVGGDHHAAGSGRGGTAEAAAAWGPAPGGAPPGGGPRGGGGLGG